jgi:hypothetical protein
MSSISCAGPASIKVSLWAPAPGRLRRCCSPAGRWPPSAGAICAIPDDFKDMVPAVLGHRLVLQPELEVEGLAIEEVIQEILQSPAGAAMIVPQNRLLFWTAGGGVLPLLTLASAFPETAPPALVVSDGFRGVGRGRCRGFAPSHPSAQLSVESPAVVRLAKGRPGTIPLRLTWSGAGQPPGPDRLSR